MSEAPMKDTLTYDEAVAMLPVGKKVHTFLNPSGGMLLGADWTRKQLLAALKKAESIHRTGPEASSMKHGLAFWDGKRMVFVETRAD